MRRRRRGRRAKRRIIAVVQKVHGDRLIAPLVDKKGKQNTRPVLLYRSDATLKFVLIGYWLLVFWP